MRLDLHQLHRRLKQVSDSLSIRYKAIQDIVVENCGCDETPRYVYDAATVNALETFYNLGVLSAMGAVSYTHLTLPTTPYV